MEILITHASTDLEYTEYFPNNFNFNNIRDDEWQYQYFNHVLCINLYKIVNKELYRML